MALRPPYALPSDVLRLYDAEESTFDTDPTDLIRDAIDDVSSDFEAETRHAFRLTPKGNSGTPSTYEHQGIEGNHRRPPVDVLLDHGYIRPFDSAEGDVLEFRAGRNDWTDITADAGDEFTLYFDSGKLRLYRWLLTTIYWDARDDRYLRASYRYGAPGGRNDQGAQTTLDGALTSGATSISVADAGFMYAGKGALIYGDNVEYVDIESIDTSTDTLTVSRAERSTTAASHSDGDTIHWCPPGFRKAVAAESAVEVQHYEPFTARLGERGEGSSAADRIDYWRTRYKRYKARYSRARKL